MRSYRTFVVVGLPLLAVLAGCRTSETSQWVKGEALAMIQENAARAARTGLAAVMENASYRVESIPVHRTESLRRMAVVTFAYAKLPGEGKPVYQALRDSQGTSHSPTVDYFSCTFSPGVGEELLAGESGWTRSGDLYVRAQATHGAKGEPVCLVEKESPAGHESYLQPSGR